MRVNDALVRVPVWEQQGGGRAERVGFIQLSLHFLIVHSLQERPLLVDSIGHYFSTALADAVDISFNGFGNVAAPKSVSRLAEKS